jgi:hypothetical protein
MEQIKVKWIKVKVWVEIKGENVGLISQPQWPNGRLGLDLASWSGAPNPSMASGLPSHCAINRGGGRWLSVRGSLWAAIPTENPNSRSHREGRSQWREVPPPLHCATTVFTAGRLCTTLFSETDDHADEQHGRLRLLFLHAPHRSALFPLPFSFCLVVY